MSSSKPQRGLGKGLGALLGDIPDINSLRKPVEYVNRDVTAADPAPRPSDVLRIPADQIDPNPYQPRLSFDRDALEELAASIRTLGLIQPITVRRTAAGRFQIISGERRFRACRIAGLDEIPAYIREADDEGMLEMAIVENVQRTDLDPIEVALSYQRLMEECSLTQEQMAEKVGKKRASIANSLRLLKLPAKVQHDLKVGLITTGHAKVLLGVYDEALQESLCDEIIRNDLSVRQLEERVRKISREEDPEREAPESKDLPDFYYRILERFGRYFGDRISLKRTPDGKGSFTIRFNSDEEMEKFIRSLD